MAKDVRKFVQTFNMSRQFNEQETLVQQQTENQPNKKRTDWSDYIDLDINDSGIGDDDQSEQNIVTEMPKPLFKKPKLRNYYFAGKEIVKGRVGDNHDIVDHCSNSMMNACDDDHGFTDAGSSSVMVKLKRPVSKRNNFIDGEDDESGCEEITAAAAFETKVNDELVEDDVYPDFL